MLIDEEHNQYLLVKTGWERRGRVHGTTTCLWIIEGRIWIEEDWAEEGICSEPTAAGAPEDDIVLASASPDPKTVADAACDLA